MIEVRAHVGALSSTQRWLGRIRMIEVRAHVGATVSSAVAQSAGRREAARAALSTAHQRAASARRAIPPSSARLEMIFSAVEGALARGASLEELVEIVRTFKLDGLTQQSAYETLATLRTRVSEERENRLLELMDLVSGWCSPQQRLW
jgi:hypothetical protein